MKQAGILLLSILFFCSSVLSQNNGIISGTAYDTVSHKAVGNATITLLLKKDSSLVTFSMTDNQYPVCIKVVNMGYK